MSEEKHAVQPLSKSSCYKLFDNSKYFNCSVRMEQIITILSRGR